MGPPEGVVAEAKTFGGKKTFGGNMIRGPWAAQCIPGILAEKSDHEPVEQISSF